jgi:hypothetical protein
VVLQEEKKVIECFENHRNFFIKGDFITFMYIKYLGIVCLRIPSRAIRGECVRVFLLQDIFSRNELIVTQ